MFTVREIQSRTTDFFRAKAVPNPKLDTDLLLAHVLGLRRLDLYLDMDRPLTEAQLNTLRPMVKRRADREPLQYILGTVEFCGLQLKVDARALIPRPETEELVEKVIRMVESPPKQILELGTGSGAIAIALAQAFRVAQITAVDFSAQAICLAKENTEAGRPDIPIRFLQGSWFEPLEAGERFDLIISNPPYLTEEEMTTAEPEVTQYEPRSALVAGLDGLDDIRQIIEIAPSYLSAGGILVLETGMDQHERMKEWAISAGFSETYSDCDINRRERFFTARMGSPS
ncbi:MAG: peptide chain release factor N(5)-glutamine methyltransferase [Coraliomargaritaceae bacterium]